VITISEKEYSKKSNTGSICLLFIGLLGIIGGFLILGLVSTGNFLIIAGPFLIIVGIVLFLVGIIKLIIRARAIS